MSHYEAQDHSYFFTAYKLAPWPSNIFATPPLPLLNLKFHQVTFTQLAIHTSMSCPNPGLVLNPTPSFASSPNGGIASQSVSSHVLLLTPLRS